MADNLIYIYLHQRGEDCPVGRLWTRSHNGRESATFRYDENWLKRPDAFALEPSLPLVDGAQYTPAGRSIFACFTDCAPDTWGRVLIRRYRSRLGLAQRHISEVDYMLAVDDFSRAGALRFKLDPQGDFLSQGGVIPPLVDIRKLLAMTERVLERSDSDDDLRQLVIPASSLGGARPKASVQDAATGELFIAKFPRKDDSNSNVLWEAVALTLAQQAGLRVQQWRLEHVGSRAVLLLKRFDRAANKARIPFISAMSMLGAADGESNAYSYLDLAEIIRSQGVNVKDNMRELWSRILFSVLISNTDDHLRNHGFLRAELSGWTLSPLYDVNPSVEQSDHLQLNIDESSSLADVDLVLSVADAFGLSGRDAEEIWKAQRSVVSGWRDVAKKIGIKGDEIRDMAHAFRRCESRT